MSTKIFEQYSQQFKDYKEKPFGRVITEEELIKRCDALWPYKNPLGFTDPEVENRIMTGAVELHAHGSPAAWQSEGRANFYDTAVSVSEAKYSAIVFKDQDCPSYSMAGAVQQAINDRASEWSNSGHGFLGLSGKHSFNSYLNDKGASWYGWAAFNKVLKENGYNNRVSSAQELWKLSPEMMQLLRDYAPKAWAELLNTDGESNPSELIEQYIANAGKIDELTSALNEKLTGYSWDAFKSSYVDMLKDLDNTTENFADKLEEIRRFGASLQ